MKQNIKKIVIVNTVCIFVICIIANILCLRFYSHTLFTFTPSEKITSALFYVPDWFRPSSGEQYKKNGEILLLGCSFVYGYNGKDEQRTILLEDTFSYKLANYAKYYVHNKAIPAAGLHTILYFLKTHDFYFDDVENPKYVVYTFIDDHIRRMFVKYFSPEHHEIYQNYDVFKILFFNKFEFRKTTILDCFMSDNYFLKALGDKLVLLIPQNIKFKIFKKYILEINKNIKNIWPEAKFVIVLYPNTDLHNLKEFKTTKWKEIEKEGIQIIQFDDTMATKLKTEKKYFTEDKIHPSKEAWDLVVPEIKKQLKL